MARFVNFTGIVAAAIVLLAVSASAQDGAQPQVSCVNAQNIAFNTTKVSTIKRYKYLCWKIWELFQSTIQREILVSY